MYTRMLQELETRKIVPVIALNRAQDALPLAQALKEGGLPVAEITFRTEAAPDAIDAIVRHCPDVLVGAGTVTSVEQARKARDLGCAFLVTPGFSRAIIQFALKEQIPIFPGVLTPSELMMVMEYGLPLAKLFPASQLGGPNGVKALCGPFPSLKFMPTGGIHSENLRDYLAIRQVIACGGSWMVQKALIDEGNFAKIAQLVREAVELVQEGER